MASKLSCCRKWHHYCLHITSTFGFHQLIVSCKHHPFGGAYFFPCVIWDILLKLTTVDTLARHISRKIQWTSTHGCKSKWEFQVVKVIAKSRCVVRSDVMYAMGTHNLHFEGLWPISSLDRNTPMFHSLWVYLRPRWCLNRLQRKYMRQLAFVFFNKKQAKISKIQDVIYRVKSVVISPTKLIHPQNLT